jgi:hypothetical protein
MNLTRASKSFFCKDEQKYHEDEQKHCKSKRKILSELCEVTRMQASEAHQHEQTILNGVEAMGNNIAKVISSEIQAMSAHMDMLNQASLDAIIKPLNASNHAKETPKSPTVDYTMTMSKSPSMPNSNPVPS